ncbi:MAG: DUF6293 family protein [Thermoplasmata archaeon]
MSLRTLIATMGFDERHILPSLRLLPYDRLILVAGRDTFRSEGFRRLRSLEPDLQFVRVNAFHFADCLESIQESVRLAVQDGPVRISATGGTKILTMAAVLAAFQEGVEAWYCDPVPVRLPVLRGVRLAAAFSPAEGSVIRLLRRASPLESLIPTLTRLGFARRTVLGAVHSLAAKGLLDLSTRDGRAIVAPSPRLALVRVHLSEKPEKA